jgi:hypothetical protein
MMPNAHESRVLGDEQLSYILQNVKKDFPLKLLHGYASSQFMPILIKRPI